VAAGLFALLLASITLPSAFVSDADWSVLAMGIGVIAAVTAGLHLRREQRRAVRQRAVALPADANPTAS